MGNLSWGFFAFFVIVCIVFFVLKGFKDKPKSHRVTFGLLSENEIYIELKEDNSTNNFKIVWLDDNGSSIPSLSVSGSDLQFIAMHPELLSVFVNDSNPTIDNVLDSLSSIANRIDLHAVKNHLNIKVEK